MVLQSRPIDSTIDLITVLMRMLCRPTPFHIYFTGGDPTYCFVQVHNTQILGQSHSENSETSFKSKSYILLVDLCTL